jgi:TonB-linked SusC/RagA family outer membrane protein
MKCRETLFSACTRFKNITKNTLILFILFIAGETPSLAQLNISGIVTGNDGTRLVGVNVVLKGSTSGTQTDTSGFFHITAKKDEFLIFSFVGHETREYKIMNDLFVNMIMPELIDNLNEVVVTGYTSEKVKNIASSVVVVNPKLLVAIPDGQVEQMLQGRVAGLTVITSGEPGSESIVRLHGIGNFGDVTPLYIIDGVQGDLNSLNPYDIESLQVLKDAGAYSIYGVRGANGAIVVTTKKGKTGRTSIVFNTYFGETFPKKGLNLLTPQQNADLLWTSLRNSGILGTNGNPFDQRYGNGPTPILPDYIYAGQNVDTLYEGSPFVNPVLYNIDPSAPNYQIVPFNKTGTDWYHELFQPAFSQNYDISISGGMDKSHYLFSLGYLDQNGTMLNTYLKRFTARINTEFTVYNNLHLGENLQLTYRENPKYSKSLYDYRNEISRAMETDPAYPIYDINGAFVSLDGNNGSLESNPVAARVFAKDNIGNNWQVFGNAFAELDFLKYFLLRSSFGGTLTNYYNTDFQYGSYSGDIQNNLSEISGYSRSWTWTNTLSYSQVIGERHNIKALVGIEEISNYNRELGGTRQNFFTNDPNYRFLTNGTSAPTNYSIAGSSNLSSFISRLDYEYGEKYILSATLRRDGSSIFGPENQYGWFPALSLGWRITQENFLKESVWLTELKLRASWGKTGYYGNTDPLNQYTLYGGTAGDAFYDIHGISSGTIQQGFRTVRIGNAKTGWQEDIVTNIGLDAIFWNGKLSITSDWYDKTSSGLLFPVSLPDYIQGDAIPPNVNVGNIQNRGFDLLLGSKGRFSKNWSWDVLVTFSHYDNKIVTLNKIPYFDANGDLVRNAVGYPIGSFFGYEIIGYFQDTHDVASSPKQQDAAPGRFKYLDANKDGLISDADRVHFGNPNPQYSIGINIGINYKQLDFSTFFYGSFGNDVYNSIGDPQNSLSAWTPQRGLSHMAKAPILEADDNNFSNYATINSYGLEKGSYFRNKSMIIGYTFPVLTLQNIKIKRLRLYAQVVNLFTLTKYTGLDPELADHVVYETSGAQDSKSSFGIDNGNYPNNQIQIVVGINLGL